MTNNLVWHAYIGMAARYIVFGSHHPETVSENLPKGHNAKDQQERSGRSRRCHYTNRSGDVQDVSTDYSLVVDW